MTETLPAQRGTIAGEEVADLRRVGIHPDFWYPVAVSASVRRGKTFAARFAGERIALYRSAGGVVYALEDLKAWADRGAKTSTSDPGAATVLPAKRHAALRPYAGKGRR